MHISLSAVLSISVCQNLEFCCFYKKIINFILYWIVKYLDILYYLIKI